MKATRLALVALIRERIMYALRQHRALDIAAATRDEIGLLAKLMAPKGRHQVDQAAWEAQLQLVLHLLAQAIGMSLQTHPYRARGCVCVCVCVLLNCRGANQFLVNNCPENWTQT